MTIPYRLALRTSIALFVCSIALFTLARQPVAYASKEDQRKRGAIDFQKKGCERCHSISGIGGDRAPDLAGVGQRRGERQIQTQILNGGHGMPPFKSVLSKDEVKDLVAFLTSCRADTASGCRQWMASPSPQ
jgi:mono/diheme cytochrome c family protein